MTGKITELTELIAPAPGVLLEAVDDPSGSPVSKKVTASNLLTAAWPDQSANTIFAGPASDGAATPGFRALVADDIPSLGAGKIGSGTLALARGGSGADLSGTGPGILQQASAGAAVTLIKSNIGASTAPTANEDSGDGYAVGSLWIDTTADKVYMATDVSLAAAAWKDLTASGVTDHGALTGLSDDDHSQYALLTGRAGSQTLIGGTGAGDNLILQATSNATDGNIQMVQRNGTTVVFDLDPSANTLALNGAVTITGQNDANQLVVDGAAGQSSDIFEVSLAGTPLFQIQASGDIITDPSELTNVKLGDGAGASHTGTNSFFAGSNAGNKIGNRNHLVVIGNDALKNATSAETSFFAGSRVVDIGNAGGRNVVGGYAASRSGVGNDNVIWGYLIAPNVGNYNIIMGSGAAPLFTTGVADRNIIIGPQANPPEGDNQLWIANTNTSDPLIYGEFDNDLLNLRADVLELERTETITGGVTDGYNGTLRMMPTYDAAAALTVDRHNYFDIRDVLVTGAGPAAVTDAPLFRFDAALGTHKTTTNADKTGNAKAGTIIVNVNGTLYDLQLYAH